MSALTDSPNPRDYLKKLRKREESINEGWGQFVTPLGVQTSGGIQQLNCVNTENAFRLIQSIPSKKAEPFKRWLAQVGYERVQEIEDPELAQRRMKELYRAKGYSNGWIEKRARGIAIRDELIDEWQKRDVETPVEFAILTAEISKATFGMTPSEYRELKGLEKENLRDHMDDLELIFTMLGEASTTRIARNKDAQGFVENKKAANEGGRIIRRKMEFCNLDAIISIGYRVNSYQATQFRIWATRTLKEYIIKGFVLDDYRLKQGNKVFGKDYFDELLERIREIRASERRFYQKISDIYALSADYDKDAPITNDFSPMSRTNYTGPSQENCR